MANALIETYLKERDDQLNTIKVLQSTALERGGEISAQDLELMERCQRSIDAIDAKLKVVGESREMDEAARAKLLAPTPETGGPRYRHAGELVWDCLHATYGSNQAHEDQEARKRYEFVMKRAAQHMGTSAEETTPVAGGMGYLTAVPVVGPVIGMEPAAQPFLAAIGRRPAPDSMSFVRPRIVDPDFPGLSGTPGVAPQTLQKEELVSRKFDIKVDTLNLVTVGGYLNVSQQLMSLQPASWNIIISQMQRRLARAGELAAINEADQTGATVTLPAGSASGAVLAALFEAAALVYENTGNLPTWVAYGPRGWAMLGALVDAAGRPLFPFLGASNAMGSAALGDFNLGPLGLTQVVTPGITDTTIYVGNPDGLEAYVFAYPLLEAVEPSLLGRQIAVAESMALYRPTTREGDPTATPTPIPAEANGIVAIRP